MPNSPHKACNKCGCPNYSVPGKPYCEKHLKEVVNYGALFDKTRETAVKRGYDTRHNKERKRYLYQHPLCEVCNRAPSSELHHNDGNPFHRCDDNYMALCKPCHSSITINKQGWNKQ